MHEMTEALSSDLDQWLALASKWKQKSISSFLHALILTALFNYDENESSVCFYFIIFLFSCGGSRGCSMSIRRSHLGMQMYGQW